ncbi:MAG: hypothetical protein M3276_02520 [Actinomycetota bacterium]|nr:hypothetical protein [Actinomycetota bacterium]
MFERIAADDAEFARVGISADWVCLEWPGRVDLDPEVLYGLAVAGRASTAT